MGYIGKTVTRAAYQHIQNLSAPVNISISGDAAGGTLFDGSQDISIPIEVVDDSHNHVIENVDELSSKLQTLFALTTALS